MSISQVIAFAVLVLLIGGLAFSFFGQAPKLKLDDRRDNWGRHTAGSDGHTPGDGASPSA
ncbi:MAG: hypothetical protein JO084_05990 [Bradyrhizobiaceae bacterium]|nr:hypothetical protein [Bradyrhizobiaceae bacterium]